ncbi:hypothetical protein ACVWWR_001996 [Bradyrhizobium sp. LM3.2]
MTPPTARSEQFEASGGHRHPVKEDDVENDPADRKETGDDAQHRSADRHVGRHGEDEDRDQIGHDHGDNRRNMSLDAPARDQDQ